MTLNDNAILKFKRMDINYPIAPPPEFNFPKPIENLIEFANNILGEGHHLTLDWAEHLIAEDTFAFVRTGIVASVVRHYKTYFDLKFHSFKDWCERALKRTHWHIKRTIEAARVVTDLIEYGFTVLPNCEAQCRPLVKFFGEDLAEKWQQVLDRVPEHQITAGAILAILEEDSPKPKKKKISISSELAEKLAARAAEAEMSVEELIEELLAGDGAIDTPDPDAIARWEEDLERLASEEPDPVKQPLKTFDRFFEEMERLQASMGLCRPPKKKRGDSS